MFIFKYILHYAVNAMPYTLCYTKASYQYVILKFH